MNMRLKNASESPFSYSRDLFTWIAHLKWGVFWEANSVFRNDESVDRFPEYPHASNLIPHNPCTAIPPYRGFFAFRVAVLHTGEAHFTWVGGANRRVITVHDDEKTESPWLLSRQVTRGFVDGTDNGFRHKMERG
jgi:hypothetical protein